MELGTSYQYRRSGVKRSLVEKKDTFQYVPFIKNLEWILQNKDVYNEVRVRLVLTYLRHNYYPIIGVQRSSP